MAGRPRRPLWKRAYSSYRLGEKRRPDVDAEPVRLSLFLPGRLLDQAETLSMRAGAGSLQAFCEALLSKAIEDERARHRIDDAEARHGRLEGYRAIADDPEFLAELSASVAHRDGPAPPTLDAPGGVSLSPDRLAEVPVAVTSASAEAAIRHAGLDPGDGQDAGFLACLRRGDPPDVEAFEELGKALVALDRELRGADTIDLRLAHALHRLALESQVLHTDAWPGRFDEWTLDAIRAVQATVERLLSGRPSY